jgi:hypothetical protein
MAACAVAAAAIVMGLRSAQASLADGLGPIGDAFASLPRSWLYVAAGAIAASYAFVIGAGAAAYRAFARGPLVRQSQPI